MNYSEMSDFEINCAVAKALGYNRPGFLSAVLAGEESEGEKFDPCNSWADAGPIIEESKISLHAPRFVEGWMAEYTGSDDDVNDGFEVGYHQAHDLNPRRAGLIVFLMMKEADNG